MARIYQTSNMGDAHFRVNLSDRGTADLLIHRVNSYGLAHGDARWYITRDKQEADIWLYFTSLGMAQFKVCFVDSYGEAGWQRPHPLQGRLTR